MKLTLRPHHILCRLGFIGYGYSPEFIQEMGRTVKAFDSGRVTRVVFQPGPDHICAACPHHQGECAPDLPGFRGRAAAEFDRRAQRALRLKLGYAYTLVEVEERIAALAEEELTLICQGCEWQPLGECRRGYQKLKQKYLA